MDEKTFLPHHVVSVREYRNKKGQRRARVTLVNGEVRYVSLPDPGWDSEFGQTVARLLAEREEHDATLPEGFADFIDNAGLLDVTPPEEDAVSEVEHVCRRRDCNRPVSEGSFLCSVHTAPQVRNAELVRAVESEVAVYAVPVSRGDEPSIFESLRIEHRRILGNIAWLEAKVAAIAQEGDLMFGLAERECVNATEFPGINEKHVAGVNVYMQQLDRERDRLARLVKIMASPAFKAGEVAAREQGIMFILERIYDVVRAMGRDLNSEKVQRRLLELNQRWLADAQRRQIEQAR